MLIVQKFGGSSLADEEKLAHAAERTAEAYRRGDRVVTVVSAQGGETDALLARAREVWAAPEARELDALLATGELQSAALLALELEKRGLDAVSLAGWQCGIHTDFHHGDAVIERVDTARLRRELDAGRLAVVAGFQGVDDDGDVTTLGRGGSDTTAVALAAALGADRCRIYTDVDGVYTADPRAVPHAKRLDAVSWEEMLALAERGSRVLHDRCVALAMERGVTLEVLSAGGTGAGTLVGAMPPLALAGVTRREGAVSVVGSALPSPVAEAQVRAALDAAGIPVVSLAAGPLSLTAQVPAERAEAALRALHAEFFE